MPKRGVGMSERQYEAHAGISRGAIQKAKAAGRIVMHPDGSIDAAASDVRRAQATDPSKQRGRQALKAVPEAAVGAVAETLRDQGMPAPVAGGGMTYLQARTANEVLKAQERRLRVEKLKGQLVDVAQVRAKVFRFAREQRDSWLNWPNRVAAIIAAEYEIDDASSFHATLVEEVRRHLEEIADSATKI
jgi:hypothetical protein